MMRFAARMAVLAVALATAGPGFAQKMPSYEPSSRVRLAREAGCMKDEVARGAPCVKKCAADFRLDLEAKPPACIGTKADARYVEPQPEFVTPRPKGNAPAGKGSL